MTIRVCTSKSGNRSGDHSDVRGEGLDLPLLALEMKDRTIKLSESGKGKAVNAPLEPSERWAAPLTP